MWFQIYKTMSEYYVEVFLGISIGAFVISVILLITFLKEKLYTVSVRETIMEKSEVHEMRDKQIGID